MQQILIDDISIDIVRKNIKNLRLVICRLTGSVRITVPNKIKYDMLHAFILSKLAWIKKHKARIEKQKQLKAHDYISGEKHYFEGECYLLNVIESNKNKVMLRDKKYIDFFVKKDTTFEQRKKIMEQWQKRQLREKMVPLIQKWQNLTNLKASHYSIKKMKTLWGSCNIQSKRISINMALIEKPTHCLEYIIVHELVHFLERLHNAAFKAHMDRFMPQWRDYQRELKLGYAIGNDGKNV